ncbi:MAG: PspC domain-containing protein [Chloroflexi bacterium]|nr:PspC domain-containing protein [Chloroflexota bacterium]
MKQSPRLTRSLINRTFGGVCGGLGTYLDINPWWVRIAFIALTLFTLGTGIIIYAVLWIALPEQTLDDLRSSRDTSAVHTPQPETLLLIGTGVIITGILVMALNLGVLDNTRGGALLPFAVILLGLTLFAQQLRRSAS